MIPAAGVRTADMGEQPHGYRTTTRGRHSVVDTGRTNWRLHSHDKAKLKPRCPLFARLSMGGMRWSRYHKRPNGKLILVVISFF